MFYMDSENVGYITNNKNNNNKTRMGVGLRLRNSRTLY